MIDQSMIAFQNGYAYIKDHPQLLVTMLLILCIPAAFLLSGQQFLNAARLNQETLERERIGTFHDVFASYLSAVRYEAEDVQEEIERLAAQNPDLTHISLSREDGENIEIIASLDVEEIGTVVSDVSLHDAAHLSPGASIIRPASRGGARVWQSMRLLETETDSYYVYTEASLAHIDALFASRIRYAYYWLFGILAIVLLLVFRHVRLIDYAYLYRKTKHANEMKDLFTNMIAHELRTPLTAIRGYASMILERTDTASETRTAAGRIDTSAQRLIAVVNDLLDVARMQSGKLALRSERICARKVVIDVTEALRPIADEKHIVITTEIAAEDLYIQGDEKRLYQALTNLVSNALKYTKAGSIAISLEERSDRIEIRVKDTGVGMSAAHQKQLFAPFFRIENTDTNGIPGTGLGMWITKHLIELMHGSIDVESIKGVGTHVVVTLPKE